MFDLGFQEIIIILIVALLVFGPRRLPELARTIGRGMGELRRAFSDVKHEFEREMEESGMDRALSKTGEELNRVASGVREAERAVFDKSAQAEEGPRVDELKETEEKSSDE